ncbi:hypothetical protein D3C73_537450 [compost metagenome]
MIRRNQGRKIIRTDPEPLHHGRCVRIVHAHDRDGIEIADEKPLDTQQVAAFPMADENAATGRVAHEAGAAKDVGSDDRLADIRLSGDQRTEFFMANTDHPRAGKAEAGQQNAAVGEHVLLTAELTPLVAVEMMPALDGIVGEHLQLAVQNQKEIDRMIASTEDKGVLLDLLLRPVLADAFDHLVCQCGKGLGRAYPRIGGIDRKIRHAKLPITTSTDNCRFYQRKAGIRNTDAGEDHVTCWCRAGSRTGTRRAFQTRRSSFPRGWLCRHRYARHKHHAIRACWR